MKHSKISSYFKKGLLVITLTLLPLMAAAESSWQWDLSLWIDKTGDSMYMPSAVAFDEKSERYYVVDTGRSRLISFERDGKLIRAFSANEQLKSPFDMVRMDNGQLWVVEKGRNSLTLIDVAAKKIEPHIIMDGDQLVFPDRIAVANGKLHILDRASGQVLRLASDLSVEQRFGCPDCSAGMVDFVINDGAVLALEPRDKKVYRFNADATVAEEITLGKEVEFPVSMDVGPSGFIYVLDRHQNKVLVFSGGGQFSYSFLGTGQSAGKVYFPRQIRFDPWGRLCIVDEGNGRVEIFSR
jgi:DNA-binding beta-propeller fold protein YncE